MSNPIESFGKPVSEDLPSGENLEYDEQYREMESLAKEKGESAVESKDQKDEPDEPDWKGIEKCATELLSRTRDLRVQAYATKASIRTGGLPAFRDNLNLLNIFLEDFWDSVHPQLDPEDGNDPMLRLNTLEMLNDNAWVAKSLNRIKLVELPGMGSFGLHEVALAEGRESPKEGEEVPDANLIRQAFVSADAEYLQELRTAVNESLEFLERIDQTWREKTGEELGPFIQNGKADGSVVGAALLRIREVLEHHIPGEEGEGSSAQPDSGQAVAGVTAATGTVNSRSDVIRVLDKVCDYYSAQEPSSPVPLLLRRAQRLVEKSFMEILEDMVPDGVSQAQIVSGKHDSE